VGKSKKILLTHKIGEEFDLNLASEWTKNHRDRNPTDPHSHFFGKEILQKIMDQEGCVGLRFYYAHSEPANSTGGERHLIITGAKADGTDMLNTIAAKKLSRKALKGIAPADDIIAQEAMPCPGSPGCPKNLMNGHK